MDGRDDPINGGEPTVGDDDSVDFSRAGGWNSWSSLLVVLTVLGPLAALCMVVPVLMVHYIFQGGFWLWMAAYFLVPLVLLIPGFEALQAPLVSPRSRRPSPEELARLTPLWDRVLERVGQGKRGRYRFRVAEDRRATAAAGGGNLVVITTGALATLPDDGLEAVLAHEFGHQVGLRPAVLLMQQWLARPLGWVGRLSAAMQNRIGTPTRRGTGTLAYFMYMLAWMFVLMVRILLVVLDSIRMAARLVLSFLGRRAVYSADAVAARLGYGPDLMAALAATEAQQGFEPVGDQAPRRRRRWRRGRGQPGAEPAGGQTPGRDRPLWDNQPENSDRVNRLRDSYAQ